MTDLGRGSGADPWYPEDPLHGGQQWAGQQAPADGWNGSAPTPHQAPPTGHPQAPYGAHAPQGQPADPGAYGQQGWNAHPSDPYDPGTGHYPADPYGGGAHYPAADPYLGQDPLGQDPYRQDPLGHDPLGQGPLGHDPLGAPHPGPAGGGYYQDPLGTDPYLDPLGTTGYPDPHHGVGQPLPGSYPYQDPAGHPGHYDATGHPVHPGHVDTGGYPVQAAAHHDPGPDPQHGGGQHPGQGGQHPGAGGPHPGQGPGGQHPGGLPGGHPAEPYPGRGRPRPEPEPVDPDGDEERHPFFTQRDDEDDTDADRDDPGRRDRDEDRDRDHKPRKRRSGCACLVITLVLGGVVGTAGYSGYKFWDSRFGSPPDFSGQGKGDVEVEIPEGAGAGEIGNILLDKGVIKSVRAFTDEAKSNPKSGSIQPGVYLVKKEMSAAAAMDFLTNPKNLNALTIPEGRRATWIYAEVDKRLHLKPGTTQQAAKTTNLGLPAYAKGNPEGFLFPSRYSLGKNTKPGALLREMVDRAKKEYAKDDLDAASRKVGLSPYEIITLASIVQAEAQEDKDFGKVSRVMYNRLNTDATNGLLQMDSTVNYALNRSTLDVSVTDTSVDSPYNTYEHAGLPPAPIGNPGHQAIEAAANPPAGNWVYFVTVKPGDTRFTDDPEVHEKNVKEFNKFRREHGDDE